MQTSRKFGYLPLRLDLRGSIFSVTTLPTLEQAVASISTSPRLQKGWLLPPVDSNYSYPVFGVPFTHELTLHNVHPASSDPLSEFLVAVLGFLHGIVLIPDGWRHLTRVNTDPERMHDYLLRDSARRRVLNTAVAFWFNHEEYRAAMFGALYWHSASLSFARDFERFAWQYTVLDTCWLLHARRAGLMAPHRKPHVQRITELAASYDLKMPQPWNGGDAIVKIRNQLLHEAKWGDEPIGFGGGPRIGYGINPHDGKPMHTISLVGSLVAFTTRAILAILGESGSYVQSPIRETTYEFA